MEGKSYSILHNDTVESIFDLDVLRKIQRRFCHVAKVYAFAMDDRGRMVTEMSGSKEDVDLLFGKIGMHAFLNVCDRVGSQSLEEQVVEETEYDNVRIAAISIREKNTIYLNWIICAVLVPTEEMNPDRLLTGVERNVKEEVFLDVLDLIRQLTKQFVVSGLRARVAETAAPTETGVHENIVAELKRSECITQLLALLDSDDSLEELTTQLLRLTTNHLDIAGGSLIRINADGETVDLLSNYHSGASVMLDRTRNLPRPAVLMREKPYVASMRSNLAPEEKAFMVQEGFVNYAAMPIYVKDKLSMYLTYCDVKENHVFDIDDIKFMNDATKIMQDIIAKRVQKNSIVSSYASLESIMDHTGAILYVEDCETGESLFANRLLRTTFTEEFGKNRIHELLNEGRPKESMTDYYEIFHESSERFYEVHSSQIKWVDGRDCVVYSAFDITDKKRYQKKIEQQAYTDFLTGLYNRMCCERDLAWHIDEAKKNNRRGALLYLDLDDFKHINDGLGHQYGDVLLKAIAHELQRVEGIYHTCYRMGGDEFVVIIPAEQFPRITFIVEGIKQVFARPWFLKDADYYCTMSMGVVEFPAAGEDVQDLIKKADIAMYEAKKSGKNRVAEYTNNSGSSSNKRLDMEKNMRDATVTGCKEFEVYYQPIMNVIDGEARCCGAEALVRWNSHELGFVPPLDFIPLAEYLGLINPIGNYVLLEACKACRYWNLHGQPNYKVNVNLSVVQLLQTDIAVTVENALNETGLNPHNLTLEVTESLAINDMQRMKEILSKIQSLGCRIALDDFGTGYSSLNHIREIPFDVIKVDQSFVTDLDTDAYSQAFVRMVGELAKTLQVYICVEGIEREAQYEALKGMFVELIQGYYFGKPMPREQFEKKYITE